MGEVSQLFFSETVALPLWKEICLGCLKIIPGVYLGVKTVSGKNVVGTRP